MFCNVQVSEAKLGMLHENIRNKNLSYFPSCKTVFISPTSLGDRQMLKDLFTDIVLKLKN